MSGEGTSIDVPVAVPAARSVDTSVVVEHNGDIPGEKPLVETPEVVAKPEAPEPIPKGVQRRIDRAVRQKYEAEAREKVLQERVSELERGTKQAVPAEQPVTGEPLLKDYDDFDKYTTAKTKFWAAELLKADRAEREKVSSGERAQAAQKQTAENWNKRVSAVLTEIPDYNDVVADSDLPLTPIMRQEIMESEVGPKLAYYLATHPDEAEEIAELSKATPRAAVRALMRIEDGFKVKPTTATPAPIVPTGSRQTAGAKTLVDVAKNQSEFEKRRRAFIAKR